MNILSGLNISGLILSIFFIVLVLSKKNRDLRDYLLAIFIFLLGSFMLIKYGLNSDPNLLESYPIIVYLHIYYWLLLGPTLLVYTKISSIGENKLNVKYLFTLIPALIVTLCFYRYIFFEPLDFFKYEEYVPFYVWLGYYIWVFNSIIFYILTIIILIRHQKKIKDHYSYTKSVNLKWLFFLSNGFAVFLIFLLWGAIGQQLFGFKMTYDDYNITIFVMLAYIFGIGYYGFRQKEIFNITENIESSTELNGSINKQQSFKKLIYKKSSINEKDAFEILNKLNRVMDSEEPYLECEFDLPTLAKMINVSAHKISQVINRYLYKNFFDYINEYRIKKVKEYLTDPNNNHYKIISLAYDSGFNSKSTFYNFFKKSEGLTPAQYRHNSQNKVG